MSRPNDPNGNAPDPCPVALLIVDMINSLAFPEGEALLEPALDAARAIRKLRTEAHRLKVPVIYANDNFGRWRENFEEVVAYCLRDGVPGAPLVRLLKPTAQDYFVLKPKHSAFFATTLETLLNYLGCSRLILTGVSGDVCVQFTAQDAYMRDFEVFVPRDCIASPRADATAQALAYMERVLKADTRASTSLDLARLAAR